MTLGISTIQNAIKNALKSIILRFLDGTIIITPRYFYKIYTGYAFSVSKRFTSVAADGVVEMYFENPSNSGRDIYVAIIECVSFAQGWIDVYRNVNITSSGTSLTPINLNFKSTNLSVVNVEYGGTYDISGAQLVHETVVSGGNRIQAIGGASEIGESVIIPSNGGENFLVRFINKSGSAADMSIRALWWEEVV